MLCRLLGFLLNCSCSGAGSPFAPHTGMCRVLLLPGAVGRELAGLVLMHGVIPCPPSRQRCGGFQFPSLGQAVSESALISRSLCSQGHRAGGPRDEPAGSDAHLHHLLPPGASVWGLQLLHPPSPPPSSRCLCSSPALSRDHTAVDKNSSCRSY